MGEPDGEEQHERSDYHTREQGMTDCFELFDNIFNGFSASLAVEQRNLYSIFFHMFQLTD